MSDGPRRLIAAPLTLGIAAAAAPAAEAGFSPVVTVQDNGTAFVSWGESDAGSSAIQERPRFANGTLGDIQWISAANHVIGEKDVSGDPGGNAVHVWTSGAPALVRARRRLADGGMSAIQTISGAGHQTESPRVAVNASGDAVIAWTRIISGGEAVVHARRRSAGGALGPVLTLSAPDCLCWRPEVAIDPAGNAFVVWEDLGENGSKPGIIHMRRLAAGGAVGTIAPLSPAGWTSRTPQVGVDDAGNAIVAWLQYSGYHYIPKLKRRSAGGAYSATQTLYTSAADANDLQLAVGPDGSALATWHHEFEGQQNIRGRHRAADGSLGSLLSLSGVGGERARVSMDPGGNALVVWVRHDGATQVIEARRRSAGGAIGAIQTISPGGEDFAVQPAVDLDSAGHAVIAWQDQGPAESVIKARRRFSTGALSEVRTLSY